MCIRDRVSTQSTWDWSIMIARTLGKAIQNGVRSISWKKMDYYYNYPFSNKMEFIDHTKRYPVFRAMDLEGNVSDPKYDIFDHATATKIFDCMINLREMDKVNLSLHRQGRITFYMSSLMEEAIGPTVGCLLYTSPSPRDLSTSRMPSSA
eukprot:TRINITY_DN29658_c0_g1_i2.p1 TRINITY_DN29658_c0_g1~~TRINITY_DN29658_c0_g1_i2.p1  ORF type:complete len:150 (+),score=24.19 TRINITY_DN29658_c0_g1_i2:161-610(+)